jgi:DNA-binding winged helix-turn-helix (wHTH) protein
MRTLFGDCELDTGQRLLFRHGSVCPLSPRAYQLLELLLDRRPEAVAKTELVERLWPATFVSDASLHNLVAEVRAAIGDSPRASRYIRTVPRYGYAFKGDVRLAPPVNVSEPPRSGPRLISKRGEWALGEGTTFVGRDLDCTVRVDSHTVSRRHARIVVTPEETTIEDLGSKNGTLVNGDRITQPVVLKDGDEIHVGSLMVTYRLIDVIPSTRTLRRRG